MIEKKYNVFVSSTFEDLKEERSSVFDALLRSNCFPVGMEYFPSSNEKSLDLIKQYIDQCDYFVMISAGVYGSPVKDQGKTISFVEWEYDYAIQNGIPCLSFIHNDIGKIEGCKLDIKHRKYLDAFHQKVKTEGRNIKPYANISELREAVRDAIDYAKRQSPATGWVRANSQSHRNKLEGAWKLVGSNKNEWNSSTVVKLFSGEEFAWIQTDGQGCSRYIVGCYGLSPYGETIYETARCGSFQQLIGKTEEYNIHIVDGVMKTYGSRTDGVLYEEEYQRLDLAEECEFDS